MKRILFFMPVLLLCAMGAGAQVITIQGSQSGVLYADTVIVTGNVTVPPDESLTFVAGSIVRMTGYFGFTVQGSVLVSGTAEEPVIFTVTDTTGFYHLTDTRGGWDGFDYSTTAAGADSSVFNHCIFEYGKAVGDSLSQMGGIFNIRNFSKLRLANCLFRNNKAMLWGGAVFAEQSIVVIHDSEFQNNFCGPVGAPYGYGGAVCYRNSSGRVERCTFNDNKSTGVGGGLSAEYSDVLVRLNVFTMNHSGLGGALAYVRSKPLMTVSNNLIAGNSSDFFGGGACFLKANPVVSNNTITDNQSIYGGGIYCNDSAAPVFVNSILWGNHASSEAGHQIYIFDNLAGPVFRYCDVEGGLAAFGGAGGTGYTLPYLDNIDTIPYFSTQLPLYSLDDNSPCINAGDPDSTGLMLPLTDIAGNPRFFGVRADIGASENQNVVAIHKPEHSFMQSFGEVQASRVHIYTKQLSGLIYIDASHANKSIEVIKVTDAFGRLVKEVVPGQGKQVVEVPIGQMALGVYFVMVKLVGNVALVEKLALGGKLVF